MKEKRRMRKERYLFSFQNIQSKESRNRQAQLSSSVCNNKLNIKQNVCKRCSQIQILALTKHRFTAKFMYLWINNSDDLPIYIDRCLFYDTNQTQSILYTYEQSNVRTNRKNRVVKCTIQKSKINRCETKAKKGRQSKND